MGLLQSIGDGIKAEATAGVLVAASLWSAGCSSPVPAGTNEIGAQATDSRAAVVSRESDFASLKAPTDLRGRAEIRVDERVTRVQLGKDMYAVHIPAGVFVEIYGALKEDSGLLGKTFSTNDSFIFEVPEHDMSRYSVKIESHQFCNRAQNETDGTYILLVDHVRDGDIVSAVRFSTYGSISSTNGSKADSTATMVYLRTPDRALHAVSGARQGFLSETHTVQDYIQKVNLNIDRVVQAEDLRVQQ